MKKLALYNAFACTFLMILVSLSGCESSYRKDLPPVNDNYSRFLSEIGITTLSSKFIIVPTHGCGPCIKAAMDFLRDSVSSSNIVVVISGSSEKSCSLLMKKFNVERKDVVFDFKTRAKEYGIMTIYPVLLSYKDNSWIAVDITPENHEETLISGQF
jgi:hypothetical protein